MRKNIRSTELVHILSLLGIQFYERKHLQEYARPVSIENDRYHVRLEAPPLVSLENIPELLNLRANNSLQVTINELGYNNILKLRDTINKIICPQLTIIDGIVRYSGNYVVLYYDKNGHWSVSEINSRSED